ncbi:MAG TPA: phage holin family protein [Thermoanaerobaculia bacterium]|nr:phage holin family protein [Thermoanaerobaculia bacterium]
MIILVRILVNGLAVVSAAYLFPGIHWSGGVGALLVTGLVIGVINLLVKPVVTVLSCPLLLLTLGLFYLVINGATLALADFLLASLRIDGFVWAIVGGLWLALCNLVVRMLFEKERA